MNKWFTYFFSWLFVFSAYVSFAADWYDADVTTYSLSPSSRVDFDVYYALMHKAVYLACTSRYNGSALRLNNNRLQFDRDVTLQLDITTASDYGTVNNYNVYIAEIRPCTLLFFDNPSLANQGDLYIYALAEVRLTEVSQSGVIAVLPVANCYKLSNVVYNDLTLNSVASATFTECLASEFPFPVYLSTTANTDKFHYSFYFNRNLSGYAGATAILGGNVQNASIAYQTSQSWLNAWVTCFANFAQFSLGTNTLREFLTGVKFGSLHESNHSANYITSNILGFSQEPNGYMINYQPGNFTGYQALDYDKGGQLDISEYLLGQNMKDPSDDNPNQAQVVSDIVQVLPPSVPGENTIYPEMETFEVDELADAEDVENIVQRFTSPLDSALQQNEGYQLIKTLINPNDFPQNVDLPRYTVPFSVSLGTFQWTMPDFVIDFNWLRQSEYWSFWQSIRTILSLCLFVMTFIGCYQIYERALKYSAS